MVVWFHRVAAADPGISTVERRLLAFVDELSKKDVSLSVKQNHFVMAQLSNVSLYCKQIMIEQMAGEVEQRAEAVREAGSEILKVRRQKQELEAERDKALKRYVKHRLCLSTRF